MEQQRWEDHERRHDREREDRVEARRQHDSSHSFQHSHEQADIRDARQEHQRQHEQERQQRDIAEARLGERLAAMNEFRDQLRDQAGTFLPRKEYDSNHDALRDALMARIETVLTRADANTAAISEMKAERKGVALTGRIVVAGFGLVLTALGIVTAIIVLSR